MGNELSDRKNKGKNEGTSRNVPDGEAVKTGEGDQTGIFYRCLTFTSQLVYVALTVYKAINMSEFEFENYYRCLAFKVSHSRFLQKVSV